MAAFRVGMAGRIFMLPGWGEDEMTIKWRTTLVAVFVLCLMLAPPMAAAQQYRTTIHIAGLAGTDGQGNYNNVASFRWGQPTASLNAGVSSELTFTIPNDATSVGLLQALQGGKPFSTATLQVLAGQGNNLVAAFSLQMNNVHITSVDMIPNANVLGGTMQVVTLRFSSITYTYQPVNPVGQRAGPPLTFTANVH